MAVVSMEKPEIFIGRSRLVRTLVYLTDLYGLDVVTPQLLENTCCENLNISLTQDLVELEPIITKYFDQHLELGLPLGAITNYEFAFKRVTDYLKQLRVILASNTVDNDVVKSNLQVHKSDYVGVLNCMYSDTVTLIKSKQINGHYGTSILLTFKDDHNNTLKVFAKVEAVKQLSVAQKYKLTGKVTKQHLWQGDKETILKNAVIET